MSIDRHRVFISYYHADDQKYKDYLIKMEEYDYCKGRMVSIFEDWSVRENDIDDSNGQLASESIRRIIRDDYMSDASVLILLCGANTCGRKHVDWEIHTAMYHSDVNPQMGILVINLPSINQRCRAGENFEKELLAPNSTWTSFSTRKEYEDAYKYMPNRIIDNFVAGINDKSIVPISVVDWSRIENNSAVLKELIHNAFVRGKNLNYHYDHSTPLRRNNSPI